MQQKNKKSNPEFQKIHQIAQTDGIVTLHFPAVLREIRQSCSANQYLFIDWSITRVPAFVKAAQPLSFLWITAWILLSTLHSFPDRGIVNKKNSFIKGELHK